MTLSIAKRSRRLLIAAIAVAVAQPTVVAPVALADDGENALICSVPSALFAEWARKLAGARGGLFTTMVGGAAVTYGCTKTLKNLDSGQSGQFDLQAPDGTVISQQLSPRDFTRQMPVYTYTPTAPRSAQCAGWTIPTFYNACLDYRLDPI
jgi:hypothetical protein